MLLTTTSLFAQPRILAEIHSGIETKWHLYDVVWVCTGDTLSIDFTPEKEQIWQIDGFWISCTELTRDQWFWYLTLDPEPISDPLLPITNITRSQADSFCIKMNTLINSHWRLPTRDEWLFAFKGGLFSEGYRFSGSNNAEWVAWTRNNSGGKLHIGGLRIANELGIYDMSGNAAEMVTNGDETLCVGGCCLDDEDRWTNDNSEFTGFRIVMPEPLWFNEQGERVFHR